MKQPTVSLRLLLPAFAFSASAGIAQTPDPVDPELGANRAQVRAADELPRLPEVLNILSTESVDRHGKGLALAHLVAQGPRAVPAIFALLTGTAPIPPELAAKGPVR